MTTPRGKNADYWQRRREEAERLERRGRSPDVALLAQYVAQDLARDNGRKQKLFARSPGFFSSMDAEEFGRASSIELALRELKALGIDPGDNDPLAILAAHHAGREYALRGRSGGAGAGTQEASDASERSSLSDKLREHYGI